MVGPPGHSSDLGPARRLRSSLRDPRRTNRRKGLLMTSADFDQAIAQSHEALNTMMSGNPDGFKNLYSTADDVILGNPFGGVARGYEQVAATLERAGSNFRDGAAGEFETLACWEGADLAYTFEIERAKVK